MDSFLQLSKKKDFKNITIKDITSEASVNRATFYYHFIDKYDLEEKLLKEDLIENVFHLIIGDEKISEAMIVKIFIAMTQYQHTLETQCKRGLQHLSSNIEAVMKKELQEILYKKLLEQSHSENRESLRMASVLLSWGIYGIMQDWHANSTLSAEDYIRIATPNIKILLQSIGDRIEEAVPMKV